MSRIFVSYKRVDKDKVFPFVHRLEFNLNLRFWLDIEGIESDEQFSKVIVHAINECEVFLFMYSHAHENIDTDNDWTVKEITFAERKHKRIVFVDIDGIELPDWFLFQFPHKQIVDFGDDLAISKLESDIRRWLKLFSPGGGPAGGDSPEPEPLPNVIQRLCSNMVYVEGGSFILGATEKLSSEAVDSEKSFHRVALSPFSIGRYEVTQEEWEEVMGSNPSEFKGANRPVERVSWDDCQKFIRKLNKMTGKSFRLPTEAEWEFAARGGNKSDGYQYSGSDDINDVAWYWKNSNKETHDVGLKSPNELGLYDMSGNVWEWCGDLYDDNISSSKKNPGRRSSSSYRVNRGGGCDSIARSCGVLNNGNDDHGSRYNNIGFRLALG